MHGHHLQAQREIPTHGTPEEGMREKKFGMIFHFAFFALLLLSLTLLSLSPRFGFFFH
jgi:hypothetical protein